MSKALRAYHSVRSPIHHIYDDCFVGNNIEAENRRLGTGGKRICNFCKSRRALTEELLNKGRQG